MLRILNTISVHDFHFTSSFFLFVCLFVYLLFVGPFFFYFHLSCVRFFSFVCLFRVFVSPIHSLYDVRRIFFGCLSLSHPIEIHAPTSNFDSHRSYYLCFVCMTHVVSVFFVCAYTAAIAAADAVVPSTICAFFSCVKSVENITNQPDGKENERKIEKYSFEATQTMPLFLNLIRNEIESKIWQTARLLVSM